jgi:hypothetical protein
MSPTAATSRPSATCKKLPRPRSHQVSRPEDELRHGCREGMEDQLGALNLILNTITL